MLRFQLFSAKYMKYITTLSKCNLDICWTTNLEVGYLNVIHYKTINTIYFNQTFHQESRL